MYKGIKVAVAGSFINFSLGVFYAWSVFADGLIGEQGWSKAAAALPYTLELIFFSAAMIFAGRFQDRVGPRHGIVFSGLCSGLALILCGLIATPAGVTFSFGVLFGIAAASGYAAVTPAVIKWFPPERRGFFIGIVLMSMGAAAMIWSPLVNLLIAHIGVRRAFITCGLFLLAGVTLASRGIEVPPYETTQSANPTADTVAAGRWYHTVRNPAFILLWAMMGLSTGTGLMLIGQLVQVAQLNYRVSWGYLLVSLFAFSNTAGRLAGGMACDRIGFLRNIQAALVLMMTSMLSFYSGWGWPALVAATALMGLSYGSLYTSFPDAVGRLFGLANFGLNYGLLFSAVGLAGSLAPLAAAALADLTGSYNPAFLLGLAASFTALLLTRLLQVKIAAGKQVSRG